MLGERGEGCFHLLRCDPRYSFTTAPVVCVSSTLTPKCVCVYFNLDWFTLSDSMCEHAFILYNMQCLEGFFITYSIRLQQTKH